MKCLVILSGGMDSAVVLADMCDLNIVLEKVTALTFDYGQRHKKEILAAGRLAKFYRVRHIVHKVDLTKIGGSALTDRRIAVPPADKDVSYRMCEKVRNVALTYVPMRNTIFLAIAAAYAEVLECQVIATGFNWIDSGGYPDTRPEYVEAMNNVLREGSETVPYIFAPLIKMTKKEIVESGERLKVPWRLTWSCYEGKDRPCGRCNACVQRKKGFDAAGVVDPLAL